MFVWLALANFERMLRIFDAAYWTDSFLIVGFGCSKVVKHLAAKQHQR